MSTRTFTIFKILIACTTLTSIILIILVYSNSFQFIPHVYYDDDISKDLALKKIKNEENLKWKLSKNGETVVEWLASGVRLQTFGSKGINWSIEVRRQLEEELKWSSANFTMVKKDIAIYQSECHQKSDKSKEKKKQVLKDLIFLDNSISDYHNGTTRAKASLPCFLHLNKSKIYDAGLGVFTKVDLPKGLIFGPYEGEHVKTTDPNRLGRHKYVWSLGVEEDGYIFVDGDDENKSNWLRFANSARFEEEQNIYPIMVNGAIYYFLYKDVPTNSEILVWYGNNYANDLGIWILTTVETPGQAAPRSQIVCPTCRELPSLKEVTGLAPSDEE